jgi:trimeric autotransporter adhesin
MSLRPLMAGLAGNVIAGLRLTRTSLLALLCLLSATASFAATNVIEYTFDAAGNITNIARQAAPGFAITSFTPASGFEGTPVTIYGTGFSATPASNVVKFNGTTAAVSASTTGSISTTVPTGATTGTISVTVGANMVTSAQSFTVVIPPTPTIASFTPAAGAAAVSVSVTGTDFIAGATTVKLNGVNATATVASATSLSFPVPSSAASGKITATTAGGTATSDADFIVPPSGINAADIVVNRRMTVDGALINLATGTPNKHVMALFEGAVNGYYSIQFSTFETSPTTASVPYKVMKPDNTVLVSGNVGTALVPSIHLPKLTAAGTYSIVLSPGTATLNTDVLVATSPRLTVDGAAVATSLAFPYQSARFVFDATAGQNLSVGGVDIAYVGTGSSPLTVYRPDGSPFTSTSFCSPTIGSGRCKLTLSNLPVTGTYSVTLAPTIGVKVSGSLSISSDVTGTVVAGTPQSIDANRAGQNARLTFSGTAGDITPIKLSGMTTNPVNQNIDVTIYRPDGGFLTSSSVGVVTSGLALNFAPLPASGTYSVLVEPKYGFTWQGQVAIDTGTLMTMDGSTTSLSTSVAGETVRYKFSGTAGQRLEFGLAGLTYASPSSNTTSVLLYRPDGNTVFSTVPCSTSGVAACETFVTSLPSTGTYSLVFTAPMASTIAGGTVALSTPVTGSLVVGDPAQTIAITRPGQTAKYTFSGTSGQLLRLNWTAPTVGSGATVSVSVLKPDGSTLTSGSFVNNVTGFININSIPTAGTYTVVFDPNLAATMSAPVALVTQ